MIGFISKLHTFFPLEKESYWIENGFRWYINNMGYAPEDSRINSVQNGLLLRSDIHKVFNNYQIGINPEVSFFDLSQMVLSDNCFTGWLQDHSFRP